MTTFMDVISFQAIPHRDTKFPIYYPRNSLAGLNPGSLRSFQSTTFLNVPESLAIDTQTSQSDDHFNKKRSNPLLDKQCATLPQDAANTPVAEKKLGKTPSIRVKPKPAEYLSKALRNTGHALGYDSQSAWLERAYSKYALQTRNESRTVGRPKKPSLPVILGEYIREVDPLLSSAPDKRADNGLDIALQKVFRSTSHDYLSSRGYDSADVAAWSWIMKSQNPHQAMVRLFLFETDRAKSRAASPRIPPFIPLHLLRQQNLNAHTFRLLLIHSLHLMSGHTFPVTETLAGVAEHDLELSPEDFRPQIDSGTCMILVVRLIRHARRVWPQSLLTIARAFARFLSAPKVNDVERSVLVTRRDDRVKTDKFNQCLWLLSIPANIAPYRSTSIQQQAQFELLRAMATHKPVLPVTRQGYRAVVAVQLAHKKTFEERQSAELKAPSWPPWKEEKLGMDSQRGNEGMFSRAMQVLSQMKDAGYSHRLWEDISSILAGWDTDHSPTVQTRTFMRRPQALPDRHGSKSNHHEVWVARIRSTRTVREAWACFLSYQDHGLPPKGAVYAAMAEKLIYRRYAIERDFDQMSYALPGDGREVHPEPASARDIIYVPTEPPTVDELLDQMLAQGLRPSGRFLGLLLQSATSLRSGLHYLQCSGLTNAQIEALSIVRAKHSEYHTLDLEAFHELPDLVFASFVKFLCAHSNIASQDVGNRNILTPNRFPGLVAADGSSGAEIDLVAYSEEQPGNQHHPRALWHAIQLTKLRRAPYTPTWTHILSALTRERLTGYYGSRSRSLQRILGWHQALRALSWMRQRDVELGEEGFRILCVAFTKAIDAAIRHPGTAEQSYMLIHKARIRRLKAKNEGDDDVDTLMQHALQVLKHQFDHLVLPASKTSEHAERSVFVTEIASGTQLNVPSMLQIPSPATLHAFVRALGSVGDDEGLLHLLHWMSRSADLLKEAADEHANGDKMMRRTLVAIRVFLERRQQRIDARVPSDLVEEAYDLISRTGWDWPSDAEVIEYCQ
ncbi:hypothetical protein E8E15_008191 [Penicillium rubens]|uniref:Pc13g09800 protein n=3 Tax=Penicillium chrysogenum species complex TaxID=254878 RepID=B6H4N1_PENRW|nr:hypothetical protein E8E15_008191 [Penicillium rubens]KAJ5045915.1 hypothetical protein NUH16_002738 [Penicillium rubens]KAJ5866057.1 hypothetical protein N7534_000610 [Penicillium rubens]KZN93174.1 hypothetical protein EN45_033440 [Penicillium chrysogenum]CAP92049.1 Pc13g09800 [Penicillium rubens Wisconsin 54-1255]